MFSDDVCQCSKCLMENNNLPKGFQSTGIPADLFVDNALSEEGWIFEGFMDNAFKDATNFNLTLREGK